MVPLARVAAGRDRPGAGTRRHGELLARLGGGLRAPRRLPRGDPRVAAPPEGADIRADGGHRCSPDDVAAGEVTGQETLELHLARYEFAAKRARPGRLLDIACGVGYGTRLLTDHAAQVESALGVDLASDAVEYARGRYANAKTRYQQGDALRFEDERGFETVVSLETIEHVPDPRALVRKLASLVRPGGVLIASVPTTPSVDFNAHHLHDFTSRSFRDLIAENGLVERAAFEQVQRVNPLAVLTKSEARMKETRPNVLGYYVRHPGSFVRRIGATVRYGFCNRYLTLVAENPALAAGEGGR